MGTVYPSPEKTLAYLNDETTGHQHQADKESRCKACREMALRKARGPQLTLGKSQATIRPDEEPLSKGG